MPIHIQHRFKSRLLPDKKVYKEINTVIIGTFNPGHPAKDLLSKEEQDEFNKISSTLKFKKFDQLKNFYDRSKNRFWGVMDRINQPDFYKGKSDKVRNPNGLKFYVGMDMNLVFSRQQTFCITNGLFITDLVKEINPSSFIDIYDYFTDKEISRSRPVWNTNGIIKFIEEFEPKSIIFNFDMNSSSVKNISSEALKIKSRFPEITRSLLSTSGAAGNTYNDLLYEWSKYIFINRKSK